MSFLRQQIEGVGDAVALVCQLLALVGHAVALVGKGVTLVGHLRTFGVATDGRIVGLTRCLHGSA
ncbi:hypothetical protein acdb102_12790 [Acidothermaceae bacterium B102]|nr:hypothetical protein acdb102_12790 [Acidothermaceae bacterium B102]